MSKKFVLQAINAFNKHNIKDSTSLIDVFINADKTPTKKNLLLMVNLYLFHTKHISGILEIIDVLYDLQKSKKIKQCISNKKGIVVDDIFFDKYDDFATHVLGIYTLNPTPNEVLLINQTFLSIPSIFEKNGIHIYLGDTYSKCISYCHGGITNLDYSFCIGLPGNGNFIQMRKKNNSTFYFVLDTKYKKPDKTYDLLDYLHMVVIDVNNNYKHGDLSTLTLTDCRNIQTGCLCDEEKTKYINDIRDRCGDELYDVLVKIPYNKTEKTFNDLKEANLREFKRMSYKDKLQYIISGHHLKTDFLQYLLSK